jgi:hypothetical protein
MPRKPTRRIVGPNPIAGASRAEPIAAEPIGPDYRLRPLTATINLLVRESFT